MQATYNHWLVILSVVVAILVSFTALTLAGRVAASERRAGRLWLLGGAVAMGIGIWSMHFIGMLAFSVPIPLRYNILTTLASLLIAILTSGFALGISSRRDLTVGRLAVGSVIMGAGICDYLRSAARLCVNSDCSYSLFCRSVARFPTAQRAVLAVIARTCGCGNGYGLCDYRHALHGHGRLNAGTRFVLPGRRGVR
jgi:hypothetical protein